MIDRVLFAFVQFLVMLGMLIAMMVPVGIFLIKFFK